ncbi:signal recognition particle, SRP9/SRP14 subunit [Laetiporus sulphureus 93-53]|uniref:Signal recognition particle subunit SRP14 n=1 Tax=Laetiporus sulphureus 93-53 TaxID=1314785 RepID=A0A165FDA6_9APHY|nr:signal recognition particle, SRP9/SRP14 subunit [Laetiporus sulphureus 93-53]KZT08795.1 signal recognition particle, SRP9/SRP14 subunit [Laetiporus sulphureus 93-53]
MQLVDNDTFLQRLAALFESKQDSGTIWLTHKRLTHDEHGSVTSPGEGEDVEYPCLIRVTDGDAKLSTKVESGQLEKFHEQYGALLKSSMTTLRKRDKKREKQRAEEIARKKRRMTEQIVVEGSKRGAGRRKRQRRMKAALKQDEARKRAQEREEARSQAKEAK